MNPLDPNARLAIEIVQAVLDDLHGRKGIGHEFCAIDGYVYKDMVETLERRALAVIELHGDRSDT